jgi:ABC-2 type transport system permease protein
MTAYQAIVSARFRTLLQYRAAAFAGFFTQLFWGLIRMMIFEAFYRSTTAPQPLTYPQIVTYVWLGQALLGLLPWNTDPDVRAMIRDGAVVYEMLRPLDLYVLWYSRAMAQRTAPTVLRALPMFVVAGLFFGLQAPPSPASGLAWIVVMAGTLLLNCAWATLITISLLWTVSGEGISRAAPPLVYMLSGMLVPLAFFPGWAQGLLRFLPFRDMVDVPFRVYMGDIPPTQLGSILLHEMAWTVGLVLLGRGLLARGTRRLVVQGG